MDKPESVSNDASHFKSMLRHDAKGQLVNIMGFCREIEGIVDELKGGFQGDSDEAEKFRALLSEDLVPCLKYLSLSAQRLESIHHDAVELSDRVIR